MLKREALAKKLIVVGVDGMDPRLTRKYVDEGVMPNVKKLLEKGSARQDLTLLGAMPTVTPPMWTTLATGAYPMTHGITCFWRSSKEKLEAIEYNLDSNLCKAEQLWNVFAEAGKKTLVFHWPGSSWPPSSDSPNLMVVDGTNPSTVNTSVAGCDSEYLLGANEKTTELLFRSKAATDSRVPCMIDNLVPEKEYNDLAALAYSTGESVNLILDPMDGEALMSDAPYDVVMSPIKAAHGWENAPADAKEFAMMFSKGLIRRPCLILKNEAGIYDHIAIYKNKKTVEPIAVLMNGEYKEYVIDEAIVNDEERIPCYRFMRLLNLAEDGSSLGMWVSLGMRLDKDDLWHPKSLYKSVVENVGYPVPLCQLGAGDTTLIRDCMYRTWDSSVKWQSNAIKHLIKENDLDVVFSHFHNLDAIGHVIVKYLNSGHRTLSAEDYQELFKEAYMQTDRYIGEYLELLDEGWTMLVVSDHAQVCPWHDKPMLGEVCGVNVRFMENLGFTVMKHDENGNSIKEIDWTKTKAIAQRGTHIYLNVKGRDKHTLPDGTVIDGIVDPEDKYELEEEIMTAMYNYKDPKTGHRVITLAVRNKDAAIFGMGGPECGDIIYFIAEGYNYDHAESISTTYGKGDTSVSPIFIAAGPGIKEGYTTDRHIREVDVAPTLAVLGGVRMPRQCEGAPAYQILTEEF